MHRNCGGTGKSGAGVVNKKTCPLPLDSKHITGYIIYVERERPHSAAPANTKPEQGEQSPIG